MNSLQHHQMVDRFVVSRHDVGPLGVVDGATLLGWLEEVAEATAVSWSSRPCAVRSIGDLHLDRPVAAGERVVLHTTLVYTNRSEMHIVVTVRTQRPARPNGAQIAQCSMVFAALDQHGEDADVTPWLPATMLELQRHRQARLREQMRARIERSMAAQAFTSEGTAPQSDAKVRAITADGTGQGLVRTGRVLRWIDDAVCAVATEWTGTSTVAAYLAGLRFYRRIGVDEAVTVSVRMIHTGPRSVHIGFRVIAGDSARALVARGVVTVVASGRHGNAEPVRQWRPQSPEDHRLDDHACHLIDLRQYIQPGTTAMMISEDAQPARLHLTGATSCLRISSTASRVLTA